ncbi:hypothetical protein D3C86_1581810 [compost metagenome]
MHIEQVAKSAVRFGAIAAVGDTGKHISGVLLLFCCFAKKHKITGFRLAGLYCCFRNLVAGCAVVVEDYGFCAAVERWIKGAVFCGAQSAYLF